MSLALAFLAGLLTSLSPCVLAVLPLVVGGALSQHRLGPLALCGGLTLSFSILGVTVSLATRAFGFDPDNVRVAGAVLLMIFGLSLLVPKTEEWLSRILAPIAARAGKATVNNNGLWGHFATGAMLGAVWSPCSGPALGAAVGLATEASTAARGFLLMLVFSLAASTPLLAIAYGARSIFMANRSRLAVMTSRTKPVFGLVLVVASIAILSGWDRQAEVALVKELPTGWVNLMTKF